MFKFLIVVAFAFASAVEIPIFPGQCRTPAEFGGVHTGFDVPRYLGLWYEIERYEQIFQQGGECVTAQYTVNSNPDGVRVTNIKRNLVTNAWQDDIGLAVVSFPDVTPLPAQLTVTFPIDAPLPQNSNYWVLRTDYANFAIVVSCFQLNATSHTDSYWFLSRAHPPTAASRQAADEIINAHLQREYIRPTQQNIADCFL